MANPILKEKVKSISENTTEEEWQVMMKDYLPTEESTIMYERDKKARKYLEKELETVEKYINLTNNQISKIKDLLKNKQYEKANDNTYELVRYAECITESARKIPLQLTRPGSKQRLFEEIAQRADFDISLIDDCYLKIVLGRLLPKRFTSEAAVNYLWSTYHTAFNDYYLKNKMNYRLDKVYIIYIHSYDYNAPDKAYRDNDNIETNAITDIIAEYLLKDDNPHICRQINLVKKAENESEADKTIIYLVPQHLFIGFAEAYLVD